MAELDKLSDADHAAMMLAFDAIEFKGTRLRDFALGYAAGKAAGMAQQREADAKEIESLWAHIDEANEAIRYLFPHNQLVTKQGKHTNVIAYALTSLPKRFFDSEAAEAYELVCAALHRAEAERDKLRGERNEAIRIIENWKLADLCVITEAVKDAEAERDAAVARADKAEQDAPIVSAARALVPLLIEGWDEYDEDADQKAGAAACDALVEAMRFVDAAREGSGNG